MEFVYETVGTNAFLTYAAKDAKFDQFSIKMLEHNRIEGLLPLSVIQEDADRRIRYMVTSYSALSEYMQHPLSLSKVLNILRSIAQTAIDVEAYMLYPEGLVLDITYVYVEVQTGMTHLIYLPVESDERLDILGFLKNLMGRFQYESPEKSGSILTVLSDMNSGKITTTAQFLEALQKLEAGENKPIEKTRKMVAEKPRSPRPENMGTPLPQPAASPSGSNVPVRPVVPPLPPVPAKKKEKKAAPEKKSAEEKKGVFGFLKSGKKEEQKQSKKKSPEKPASMKFDIPGMSAGAKKAAPSGVNIPVSESFRADLSRKAKDTDATMIITPDVYVSDVTENKASKAYLLRVSNGQKLFLEKEINRIGRSSSYADLCIADNNSIGRIHAEILRINGKYYIRDNDSKNHTYLNDRMLASGEQAVLEDGVQIRLSDEKLEFHEG